MKYRIISSTRRITQAKNKKIKRKKQTLLLLRDSDRTPTEASDIFDFGSSYDPYSEVTPSRSFSQKLSALLARFSEILIGLRDKILKRLSRKRRQTSILPTLCGALCAALTVALLSAAVVIYKLVIEDYFGKYESFTVPNFVGAVYPFDDGLYETDYYNIKLDYKYSTDVPEGVVISQAPAEGVTRRVYRKKAPCELSLTVSLGERTITMNDYSSFSLRDAMLELKNEAVKVKVKKIYSSSVEAGKIISTSPSVGEIFSSEDTVVLTVSLGPEIIYVTVPNVYGLTESRAEAAIKSAGLKTGKVTYVQSELPAGTVISQSHTAYSSLKEGEEVSFSVSAGIKYSEKTIPDLYGLTIEEARTKLAECGLVCGSIYGVANGAPKGTVVSQSLLAGIPIPSGVTSVDIYVSS